MALGTDLFRSFTRTPASAGGMDIANIRRGNMNAPTATAGPNVPAQRSTVAPAATGIVHAQPRPTTGGTSITPISMDRKLSWSRPTGQLSTVGDPRRMTRTPGVAGVNSSFPQYRADLAGAGMAAATAASQAAAGGVPGTPGAQLQDELSSDALGWLMGLGAQNLFGWGGQQRENTGFSEDVMGYLMSALRPNSGASIAGAGAPLNQQPTMQSFSFV